MKHLLRKLHIGGGLNEHQRFGEARPTTNPSPSPTSSTPASSSSTSGGSATMGRIGAVESADDRTAADGGVDFNLLEEEFQMQMALAISASDPDAREDPETAQINAAKRISLGCAATVPDSQAIVKFLSLRYWVGREIDA